MFELCWSRADIATCDFPAQGELWVLLSPVFQDEPRAGSHASPSAQCPKKHQKCLREALWRSQQGYM